jgi:hypothetical protein
MAKLEELIAGLDNLDPEDVICAKREWRPDAEAQVVRLTEDGRVPEEVKALGYDYFLEVDVIRQVLEEFRERSGVPLEEKCRRIIDYAIYDA